MYVHTDVCMTHFYNLQLTTHFITYMYTHIHTYTYYINLLLDYRYGTGMLFHTSYIVPVCAHVSFIFHHDNNTSTLHEASHTGTCTTGT